MRFSNPLFARRVHQAPHHPARLSRTNDSDHHRSRSRLGLRPTQPDEPLQQTTKREADIIAYYRGALLRAHAELRDSWALYEAAPDACYDTRHVRAARRGLDCAIGDLFAACGGTKPNISHVLAAAEESDRRMAVLEHELSAEVRRFELLARDVAEDSDVAAADDALLELRSFRSNTSKALSDHDILRLDVVQTSLLKLLDRDTTPPRSRRLPPQPKPRALPPLPDDEFENVPQAPEPREFPPIPPPSQQNLTRLVQSAKLYKNEVERNRGASIVQSDKSASASAESSTVGAGTATASSNSTTARSSSIINQRRGTNLRVSNQRSHSLRVPALRSPSLRRPRNMSHPQPPERDSTLGQRPVDKRSRSFMRFKVQQQYKHGGVGVAQDAKQRPSSLIKLGKALTLRDGDMRESSASRSSVATGTTNTTTLAEDPLHTQLSKAMSNGPLRSSVIESSERRPRSSSRKLDGFVTRRESSFSASVRSFIGLVRPNPVREQATNDAARLRRDSTTFERESVSCVLDMKSNTYNLNSNADWNREGGGSLNKANVVDDKLSMSWGGENRNLPNEPRNMMEEKAKIENKHLGLNSERERERRRLTNTMDVGEMEEDDDKMGMEWEADNMELVRNKSVAEKKVDKQTGRHKRIQGKKENPPSPPSPLITWNGRDSPPSPAVCMESKDKSTSGTTSSESSDLTVSSGEALPQGLVLPRAPTLRDCAEYARSQAAGEDESHLGAEPMTDAESNGRLSVRRTSAASFSATLYASGGGSDVRSEAVSDAGVMLTCSRVVGDGRCLFRSVVRGRAAGRGEPIPKPHAEKKAADRLRARTVAELRRHRGLLLQFYVIEDNFERYIERMSNPRTYAGEPELLMLAKLLKTPIAVYLLLNSAYRRIQLYGKQYPGDPIRLRYLNATHYDSLLAVNSN